MKTIKTKILDIDIERMKTQGKLEFEDQDVKVIIEYVKG